MNSFCTIMGRNEHESIIKLWVGHKTLQLLLSLQMEHGECFGMVVPLVTESMCNQVICKFHEIELYENIF
ncbi:hypothetical protein X975_25145, partial [Stegodyphus mimosarum]